MEEGQVVIEILDEIKQDGVGCESKQVMDRLMCEEMKVQEEPEEMPLTSESDEESKDEVVQDASSMESQVSKMVQRIQFTESTISISSSILKQLTS